MSEDNESTEVARQIAERLGEPNLELIERIVGRIGAEQTWALLAETLRIEAAGGLLTADGTRRRTPGGVFFHLTRGRIPNRDRWKLWPQDRPARPPRLHWDERGQFMQEALAGRGVIMSARLKLVGRPGKVVQAGRCVLIVMQGGEKPPALPKGLPKPPSEPTTYTVYIASKQWRRVEKVLEDPQNLLVVEGYPAYDARLPGLALFALRVMIKSGMS